MGTCDRSTGVLACVGFSVRDAPMPRKVNENSQRVVGQAAVSGTALAMRARAVDDRIVAHCLRCLCARKSISNRESNSQQQRQRQPHIRA